MFQAQSNFIIQGRGWIVDENNYKTLLVTDSEVLNGVAY